MAKTTFIEEKNNFEIFKGTSHGNQPSCLTQIKTYNATFPIVFFNYFSTVEIINNDTKVMNLH